MAILGIRLRSRTKIRVRVRIDMKVRGWTQEQRGSVQNILLDGEDCDKEKGERARGIGEDREAGRHVPNTTDFSY